MFDKLYSDLKDCPFFFLIAGPCVVEDDTIMLNTAEVLKEITSDLRLPLIYKSSFLKANRTSGDSYSGPGLQEGLKILQKIKNDFALPILTDVHETNDVSAVKEVADIIQIPAFLSRQTSLLIASGSSGRIVNIKKGQFMAPEDLQSASKKISDSGNPKILLTERGTSFGYHNLVVDFRGFRVMHDIGYPVVYDVTHSLQKPSESTQSGGAPQYAKMMARAAIATGYVSGLFIETHPEPARAKSDSASMLPLSEMKALLKDCLNIRMNLEK
jgi:2-dehydro-3-deoxyphosphooctonate aldolase (KDO 8-P synthase)